MFKPKIPRRGRKMQLAEKSDYTIKMYNTEFQCITKSTQIVYKLIVK